jgi:hypothetical protein
VKKLITLLVGLAATIQIALADIGMTQQEYRNTLGPDPDLIAKIGRGGVEVVYSGRSRNNGREFGTGAIFYDGHAQVVFFFYTDGKQIPLSDRQHMLSAYDGKWERIPKEEEKKMFIAGAEAFLTRGAKVYNLGRVPLMFLYSYDRNMHVYLMAICTLRYVEELDYLWQRQQQQKR